MVLFCSNCENAIATFKCDSCAIEDAFLCADCMNLHSKLKVFKLHRFSSIAKVNISCSNCDSAVAKFICRHCTTDDKYLCLGCSVIHPKVKAFRNHIVVVMEAEAKETHHKSSLISDHLRSCLSSVESFGTFCHSLIDLGYDNIHNKSYRDVEYWQTVGGIAMIVLSYYGLVKLMFGEYSSLVNICVGIILYKVLQSVKVPLNRSTVTSTITTELFDDSSRLSYIGSDKRGFGRGKEEVKQQSRTTNKSNSINDSKLVMDQSLYVRSAKLNEGDFKDEFWHNSELNRKASFRPRIRPYRRRHFNKSDDPIPTASEQI